MVKALEGRIKPHHGFVLTELLGLIDGLDETIERFNKQIEEYCHPFEEPVVLLDNIPGVRREVTEIIVCEIGINLSRFPSARARPSWAGVVPGNDESAGNCRSDKTIKDNQALSVALNQAAQGASHTQDTYLSALFRRLLARQSNKREPL